ncbi:MAG TPA: M48 family metalloprotease [Candidatus Limnocylindria bacterium]|jgi:STE24 endopeptidase|nr:M48 family metalloprotease [Candidatus Limnocylindria bacterium]
MTTVKRTLLGAATGLTLGYAAWRAIEAVRELRAQTPPRAKRDPRSYAATRRALMIAGMGRSLASLATTAFVLADPLERAFKPLPRPLRAPAFALGVFALDTLRDLGVEFVEGHVLERVYATSDQTPRAWVVDYAKGSAVGGVVLALVVALADAVVTRAPHRWPWIAIGLTPPLLAFATVVAPTFVMPLFNRYEPVTGELEARIRALAARYGVGEATILRFDMSRRTKKANAFVTGVLGTQRIALGDTLVEAFAPDETLFVVAHELGHYVRRDPWTGIAFATVALAATLLAGEAAIRRTTGRGLDGAAQGARLAFYASLAQLVLSPLANAASRALERRADRFALAATADADAGIRAFRRLGEQNLAELEPPRWAELLFGSHPSLASRIRALEGR